MLHPSASFLLSIVINTEQVACPSFAGHENVIYISADEKPVCFWTPDTRCTDEGGSIRESGTATPQVAAIVLYVGVFLSSVSKHGEARTRLHKSLCCKLKNSYST